MAWVQGQMPCGTLHKWVSTCRRQEGGVRPAAFRPLSAAELPQDAAQAVFVARHLSGCGVRSPGSRQLDGRLQ